MLPIVGAKELAEARARVGDIVDACAHLEQGISYLEWQLRAFSLADEMTPVLTEANDRRLMLKLERKDWDGNATLESRLWRATKAFEAGPVSARVAAVPRLRELRREWETLRELARALGRRRNDIAHCHLSWRVDGVVIREKGRPWSEKNIVSEEDDIELAASLGSLSIQIGIFTTELGDLLPFADGDLIITVSSAIYTPPKE